MQRLTGVGFLFPVDRGEGRRFWDGLSDLMRQASGEDGPDGAVLFRPGRPRGSLPETSFAASTRGDPAVTLTTDVPIDIQLEGLHIRSLFVERGREAGYRAEPDDLVDMHEVLERLRGHVVRLDHTGVNMPSRLIARSTWDALIAGLATAAAVYRYPTGEDWPFVLPATSEELESEITEFPLERGPKFELVYDEYATIPGLQFDLETDLTRSELEVLFPEPYGTVFPDLGEFFRTVQVAHPWSGLTIRVDLRYRDDTGAETDDLAEWLVTEGGRIRQGGGFMSVRPGGVETARRWAGASRAVACAGSTNRGAAPRRLLRGRGAVGTETMPHPMRSLL